MAFLPILSSRIHTFSKHETCCDDGVGISSSKKIGLRGLSPLGLRGLSPLGKIATVTPLPRTKGNLTRFELQVREEEGGGDFISMLNIRMSRTPIEGSPTGTWVFDVQASPHLDVVEVHPRNY